MAIIEYFSQSLDQQNYWMKELEKADWEAGKSLCRRIQTNTLIPKTKEDPKLYLMTTDQNELMAYAILAQKDDIQDTSLTPWIGYVYTYPAYRGQKLAQKLLTYCEDQAKAQGNKAIYIATGHKGLYERYGYEFLDSMLDMHGHLSRVYQKTL